MDEKKDLNNIPVDEIEKEIVDKTAKKVEENLKGKIITLEEMQKQFDLFRKELTESVQKTPREARIQKLAEIIRQKAEAISGQGNASSLVPTEVANFIMEELYNNGWIFQDLMVYPGNKGELFYPAGGITAEWSAVGTAISGSNTQLNVINYSTKRVAVGQYVDKQALSDSPVGLAKFLLNAWTNAIHDSLVEKIITGTGSGEPKGLQAYNSDIVAVTAATGHTSIATLDYNDFLRTYYAIPQQYRKKGIWIVSSTVMQRVKELADSNGRPIFNAEDETIFGRPTREVDSLPTSGTTYPVAYFLYGKEYIIFDGGKAEFAIVEKDVSTLTRGQAYAILTMYFDGALATGSHVAGLFLASA